MKSSRKTKEYIKSIEAFLIKRYGIINEEWKLQIQLLEDNITLKEAVDTQIEKDGILIEDRFHKMIKNPLIKTSLEIQLKIQQCLTELGCTPKAVGHLKTTDDNDTAEILQTLLN